MALFSIQENTQAFLKMGILGFAGSGKTTTATNVAAGLTLYCLKKEITDNNKIFFLDTETGSDFVEKKFSKHHLRLLKAKTRAFSDLLESIKEAEKIAHVLIIDSITHFWIELMEAYMRRKKREFISIADWGNLKREWRKFTDLFINSNLHIIVCGRAGFEYDQVVNNDTGKKELVKSGIKMKAENETGYEASLLVYMSRKQEVVNDEIQGQWREAMIWKDRTDTIDGKIIVNPHFRDFKPHIELLNLGGKQLGIDIERKSDEMFSGVEKSATNYHAQCKIILEEMENKISVAFSTSRSDKELKENVLHSIFNTTSWTAISNLSLDELKEKSKNLFDIIKTMRSVEIPTESDKKVGIEKEDK